jgi:hypothetical protein
MFKVRCSRSFRDSSLLAEDLTGLNRDLRHTRHVRMRVVPFALAVICLGQGGRLPPICRVDAGTDWRS